MKVIYFDIDTLRPDHLSCCGYGRPTPHIDALAADGVRFSRAYASNTPCMPARAALFTGCFGVVNGVETHGIGCTFRGHAAGNGPAPCTVLGGRAHGGGFFVRAASCAMVLQWIFPCVSTPPTRRRAENLRGASRRRRGE